MAKTYYVKIKDKTFGPMTLEALKKMATEGKLQPSDKVASDISPEFLLAGSVSFLNEIFNTYNEETRSEFSQGVNLDLLEQNSIEIYKLLKSSNELLKNIYGWMNFYFYAGMVVAFFTILAALVNNKGR